ncbi:MAG: hypothetical protein EA417_14910 [Gammaproteobacteria bacterium]|nr:MAG: hypothetical protein EA417_14910 [Gammaproteobacteria bacterium]
MSTGAATLTLVMFSSFWPFGDREADRSTDPTIATLDAGPVAVRELQVGAAPPLEADTGRAMQQYRALLELDAVPDAMRLQALRRLADLELQTGLALQADMTDEVAARRYIEAAVAGYSELLANWPGLQETDRLLYQRARAQDALGDTEAALAGLDLLVQAHPASPYAAEAQFRRGERLFVEGRHLEAEDAYAAVLAHPQGSPFRDQALYKLGWTRYRLGEYQSGVEPFMALLDFRFGADADPDLDGLSRAERELYEDTLRVLALGFSYVDGPAAIDAVMAEQGDRNWSHLLYASLGQLYLVQERYRDAASAFGAFVDGRVNHVRAPGFQQAVIDAYTQGRFPSLVLDAKEDYVVRYGLDADFWRQRDTDDHAEVLDLLHLHLADLAEHDHALAQDSGEWADQARAVNWYRKLLAWFPEDPRAGQHSFLLAELLLEAQRFEEATAAYLASAYDHGDHADAAEAGYAALLAARRHEASLENDARTSWQADLAEWSLRFAVTFPDHPEAVPVLTVLAEERFAAGEFLEAISVAERVVQHQPPADAAAATTAWTVIAHAQFDLGHYHEAEQAYRLLQGRELPAERFDAFTDRIVAAVFRQGEQARAAGEVDAAVHHFVRLGVEVPDAPEAGNALYDAGALLYAHERWTEAAPLLERFRDAYPRHALALDATRLLATALREDAQLAAAAREFERVSSADVLESDLRRESLWEAADLYQQAGQASQRRRVLVEIVDRFPRPVAQALEARHQLAELARESDDAGERRRWLEAIVAVDRELGAARTDRSRYLAAHASLELAEPLRDRFMDVRLAAPLRDSLRRKRERMEAALAAYGEAAEYGVTAVVTAATWQIAELYYQLARDLMESERPSGLADDALEQYEILLEEQAFPFEEQALDIFLTNAARVVDGVYDEWVKASFERLASISPGRYARIERRDLLAIRFHD